MATPQPELLYSLWRQFRIDSRFEVPTSFDQHVSIQQDTQRNRQLYAKTCCQATDNHVKRFAPVIIGHLRFPH